MLYIYTDSLIKKIVSIDPKFNKLIKSIVAAYKNNEQRYIDLSQKVGIPPELIAAIHYRENSHDYLNGIFGVRLRGGESLDGQLDFEAAAEEAIRGMQDIINDYNISVESKDIVAMLAFAEQYNGKGYYNNKRISPYVYSGTNVYVSGKYVEDHVYDSKTVDSQVGVYLILKALWNEEESSEENN